MKESKLVEILVTFSPQELKDFEKFIASPYFSTGRDLVPFLKILKSFYPDFSDNNFTPEYIYSKIYKDRESPGKIHQTIKTLSSDLIRTCKLFFKQIEFEKDFNRGNYYLSNQLRIRKLYKEFEKEYKVSLEKMKSADKGGIKDFISKYFLNCVLRDYYLDRDDFVNSLESSLSMNENLTTAALIVCFMFEDEKNISAGYNLPIRYTIMNNVLDNINADKLIEEMKTNNDRYYPYVLIFYSIYKMHKYRDNIEHFHELKRLLKEHQHLFGQEENYVFWNIVLTFCSVNQLDHKEFLQVYDHILANNIYKKSDEEDFHIVLFRNIIINSVAAGNIKKNQWLENFIEKYYVELHKKHRDNMYNFSYAHLHFTKENYQSALEYIGKVNYDLFIFKMDARVLLMKIYYELSYFEQIISLLDSTSHFLRNTKEFSESQKVYYRNFIRLLNELLKLRMSQKRDSGEVSFLEKKIKNEKVTVQINWLLEKISKLVLDS